jgi:hypothetical protein
MSYMKRLQDQIDNFAGEDTDLNEIITYEINQHIHGLITFNALSNESQNIMFNWEEVEKKGE